MGNEQWIQEGSDMRPIVIVLSSIDLENRFENHMHLR